MQKNLKNNATFLGAQSSQLTDQSVRRDYSPTPEKLIHIRERKVFREDEGTDESDLEDRRLEQEWRAKRATKLGAGRLTEQQRNAEKMGEQIERSKEESKGESKERSKEESKEGREEKMMSLDAFADFKNEITQQLSMMASMLQSQMSNSSTT